MPIYRFTPPEGSCHEYFVKAPGIDEATVIFDKWQNAEFKGDEEKWPKEIVHDRSNWYNTGNTFHLIGTD